MQIISYNYFVQIFGRLKYYDLLCAMKIIMLSQYSNKKYKNEGLFAIVDDDDFEYLNKYKWSITGRVGYSKYAVSHIGDKNITMHRFIMKAKKGEMIDHIDGDGLNNQKSNLRFCTNSENQKNKKPKVGGTSKYLGVSLHSPNNKWVAKIVINKKQIV